MGDTATAKRAVTVGVYKLGILIGDNHNMVRFTLVQHNIVLIGGNPRAKRLHREILAKGVAIRCRTTVFAALNRPAIHFIATGNDTIIASRGDDVGIYRW